MGSDFSKPGDCHNRPIAHAAIQTLEQRCFLSAATGGFQLPEMFFEANLIVDKSSITVLGTTGHDTLDIKLARLSALSGGDSPSASLSQQLVVEVTSTDVDGVVDVEVAKVDVVFNADDPVPFDVRIITGGGDDQVRLTTDGAIKLYDGEPEPVSDTLSVPVNTAATNYDLYRDQTRSLLDRGERHLLGISTRLGLKFDPVRGGLDGHQGVDFGSAGAGLQTVDLSGNTGDTLFDFVQLNPVGAWLGEGDDSFQTNVTSVVFGGTGNDSIYGSDGDDTLRGEAGDDVIRGEAGSDVLFGHGGDDELIGGDGHDRLVGDIGRDELRGGDGHDRLRADDHDRTVDGGAGLNYTLRQGSSDAATAAAAMAAVSSGGFNAEVRLAGSDQTWSPSAISQIDTTLQELVESAGSSRAISTGTEPLVFERAEISRSISDGRLAATAGSRLRDEVILEIAATHFDGVVVPDWYLVGGWIRATDSGVRGFSVTAAEPNTFGERLFVRDAAYFAKTVIDISAQTQRADPQTDFALTWLRHLQELQTGHRWDISSNGDPGNRRSQALKQTYLRNLFDTF